MVTEAMGLDDVYQYYKSWERRLWVISCCI
jgi:hypothetical protein